MDCVENKDDDLDRLVFITVSASETSSPGGELMTSFQSLFRVIFGTSLLVLLASLSLMIRSPSSTCELLILCSFLTSVLLSVPFLRMLESVSYTHLDVYKRQVI